MEYFIFLDGNFIPHSFITVLPTYQRGYLRETAEAFVKGGRKQKYHSRGRIELKQPIKRWKANFPATRAGLKLHAPRPNSPTRDTIKLEYTGAG